MAALFGFAVRRVAPNRAKGVAVGILVWLGITAAIGMSGALTRSDARPPPFAFVVFGTLAMGVFVGRGAIGTKFAREIPLWGLVASQAFRLPLELVMHRAASEGTMPVEMSFSGYNFDIVTGASAILVALALANGAPRWLALVWNVFGSATLVTVVSIAVLGTPMFHAFGAGAHLNTWIAYFPFVWLPTVLVAMALAGHIVVFRALSVGR